MAIVINSTPADYSSAHGDLLFVVYEDTKANDPSTYPDYKYVCDVYIGSDLVTRIKKIPNPANKRGIFNIGDIVRSYVSASFNPTPGQFLSQEIGLGGFFVNATVRFGEEYGFVLTTNITNDIERTYFNNYNGRLLGETTLLQNYLDKVLSNRPYITSVTLSNNFVFIPFFPTSTDVVTLFINKFNDAGISIDTTSAEFSPSAGNSLQLFNISPEVINANTEGFIDEGVSYYTVEFQTDNIEDDSIYRFDVICEPRYEIYTLHFLNKLGGFESYNFNKVSRKSIDIEKKSFGKLPYEVDETGEIKYFNSNKVYNETVATYSSRFTEKLTLNTDFLTDDEFRWLSELIVSPLIYIETGAYFVPVLIKATSYEYKKRINDKLTNLTIDIEFGDQFNAQYR